jgi:hypothetical protein
MEQEGGLKQPALGIVATIIVMFLSFGLIMWFTLETFLGWAGYLIMTCIPISIIIALVWQGNYPPPAAKLDQPLKGMYLLFFIMLVGGIVAAWSQKTIGGGVEPPTPFVLFFTILSVTTTVWLSVVWQCWPAVAISKHPAFVGFGTLILSYIVSLIQYYALLDFSFLKGAPFYREWLDPQGAYMAWVSLSFILTTVAVILAFVELDFWPFSAIAAKAPSLGKQPLWGIVVTISVLIVAYIVRTIFVNGFGMDTVVYSVRVPMCLIFGEFLMLLMFQTAPVQTMKQPAKGFILIILTVFFAVVMYYLYGWLSQFVHGKMPSGPPAYVFELWVATSLLSITFPLITVYSGFFNFWPLTESRPKD